MQPFYKGFVKEAFIKLCEGFHKEIFNQAFIKLLESFFFVKKLFTYLTHVYLKY